MCNPVAVAGGQFAGQALGAIGSHQSAIDQASATNRSRANQYKNQLAMRQVKYEGELGAYTNRIADYDKELSAGQDAYSLGIEGAQGQLNEAYGAAKNASVGQAIQLAQRQGQAAARGQTGRSAGLAGVTALSAYGRDQSDTMDNLLRARFAYDRTGESMRQQLLSSNRQAYNRIGAAPIAGIAPPKPVYDSGPSNLALAGNLIGSAASSVGSAYQMSDVSNGGSWFDWKS